MTMKERSFIDFGYECRHRLPSGVGGLDLPVLPGEFSVEQNSKLNVACGVSS